MYASLSRARARAPSSIVNSNRRSGSRCRDCIARRAAPLSRPRFPPRRELVPRRTRDGESDEPPEKRKRRFRAALRRVPRPAQPTCRRFREAARRPQSARGQSANKARGGRRVGEGVPCEDVAARTRGARIPGAAAARASREPLPSARFNRARRAHSRTRGSAGECHPHPSPRRHAARGAGNLLIINQHV